MSAVGTIRKAVLNGISFDVMADSNVTFNRSKYEREGIPTSGRTLQKMTKRVQTIEGLTLGVTPAEMESLKDISDGLADVTMSLELADTSTYKASGRVFFENYESENGQASVTLIPTNDWTAFTA